MARAKKPIDYINELCYSKSEGQRTLGKTLDAQYERWIKTLALKDFLEFNETIMANKAEIGVAQFFGKFRAYAFEEYIFRLIKEKIIIKKPFEAFWGEKCLVWQSGEKSYAIEFDISIGQKICEFIDPLVVFDAKVELDSARLKTALASFAILKRWKPAARCVLVYVTRELDDCLLELAKNWIDGVFQFSRENDETAIFLSYVTRCLSMNC
ncbi:MAG: hypothetical protein QXQ50_02855 [Candidatus Bathyarchaeia archaeon]